MTSRADQPRKHYDPRHCINCRELFTPIKINQVFCTVLPSCKTALMGRERRSQVQFAMALNAQGYTCLVCAQPCGVVQAHPVGELSATQLLPATVPLMTLHPLVLYPPDPASPVAAVCSDCKHKYQMRMVLLDNDQAQVIAEAYRVIGKP
jgi:hypothetical protein